MSLNCSAVNKDNSSINQPRAGNFSEKQGAYELAVRLSNDVIDPGELLEVEIYISGYGEIRASKLVFYFSPNSLDINNSYFFTDFKKTSKGSWAFGGQKRKIDATGTGNTLRLEGGLKEKKWSQATLYFDTTSGILPQIITETKQGGYAPFHLKLAIGKTARPGTHRLQFVLTYFNGKIWQNSSQVISFSIRNIYQRKELFVWVIGILAAICTIWPTFWKVLKRVGRIMANMNLKVPMVGYLICALVIFLFFLFFGWGKDVYCVFQTLSILFIFCGTYLITKTTFVTFMISEYGRLWEERRQPTVFFKFACSAYFIKLDDLGDASTAVAPDFPKFRKAVSFSDPFRGFLWVSVGSLIQLIQIFAQVGK